MRRYAARACALVLFATGCVSDRQQSALGPAGPYAHASRQVLEVMLPIAAVAYLAVLAALFLSVRRRDHRDARSPQRERRAGWLVSAGVIGTVVTLFAVLVHGLSVAREMAHPPASVAASIRLIGHQWWWEVEYQDSSPQRRVVLANEMHLPVGRPVRIDLTSSDVIHSFWVPNLAGKKDLIPGHPTSMWLRADRPGRFRGQCAEFCGAQHAHMALMVVAEPQAEFAAWLERQRRPANVPESSLAPAGRVLFESGECAVCHTVSGTSAGGRVGPNLTHVASRLTLAAGILDNTPDQLARWVRDPQEIKPGAQMPAAGLPPEQLRAIVEYLETLK